MNISKVKYLGIDRCFKRHQDNILELYREIGCSGQVVGGEHIEIFENNLKLLTKRKHAISVANASDGVYFALKSVGIRPGDEVLTTAYSFHATAESIKRTGGTPVFVDVDEHYHLDLNEAKKKITEKTKAIVVVNLFGDCINFDELIEFVNEHKIFLIEDAAQSLFSYYRTIPSGALGHISVFSFAPSKNIPGLSHGGCVLTDLDEVETIIRAMKLHGKTEDGHIIVGYNSIMSSMEAAQINYFYNFGDVWQNRRRNIAEKYIEGLSTISGYVTTPLTRQNVFHSWHKFVIRVDKDYRNDLKNHLNDNDIECGIHYPVITPHEPLFASDEEFPMADLLSKESLSLPIYPELKDSEVNYIIEVIRIYFGTLHLTTPTHKTV